jgi:hypothetical protein
MTETVFMLDGFTIDLDALYRAMYAQSVVEDGVRVFHGNSGDVRAVKRLLHDLFDVPVRDRVHPVNNRVRKRSELRLAELGWAIKDEGRSARYELFRELKQGERV